MRWRNWSKKSDDPAPRKKEWRATAKFVCSGGSYAPYFIRYKADRKTAPEELFRHDAPRDRMAGTWRGVLFHRGLPCAHHRARSCKAARIFAWCGARFPRMRARSGESRAFQAIRRAGCYRTLVDSQHDHADADAGKCPRLQGPSRKGT